MKRGIPGRRLPAAQKTEPMRKRMEKENPGEKKNECSESKWQILEFLPVGVAEDCGSEVVLNDREVV